MFDQTINRIGFACKIQSQPDTNQSGCATKTTTLTWLNNQPKDTAVQRIYDIAQNNCKSLQNQMLWLSKLPPQQRMMRLSSDLLPAYTHDSWSWLYFEPDMVHLLEKEFGLVGDLARKHDIRLSFHPGQFCVLASESDNIVENSLQEFEYHADMARYMGFGRVFQDLKCNVHISGKRGPNGIKSALKKLSREARNIITIENSETGVHGIESSLELVTDCALVLDIHHHVVKTNEYIKPTDDRFKRIIDSWRGVRPTIHFSQSRESILVDHDVAILPNILELKQQGFTITKLRAHSDYLWNKATNLWALEFLTHSDIMVEAKQKNLASQQLVNLARSCQNLA